MEHKLAEDGEGAVVQGVSHHSFRPLGVPGVSGVPSLRIVIGTWPLTSYNLEEQAILLFMCLKIWPIVTIQIQMYLSYLNTK